MTITDPGYLEPEDKAVSKDRGISPVWEGQVAPSQFSGVKLPHSAVV